MKRRHVRSVANRQVYQVYIGRKHGAEAASPLANPYRIGRDGTRAEVVAKYRAWLWAQIRRQDAVVLRELGRLAGIGERLEVLCWCRAGQECQGDVVLRAVRWYTQQVPGAPDGRPESATAADEYPRAGPR